MGEGSGIMEFNMSLCIDHVSFHLHDNGKILSDRQNCYRLTAQSNLWLTQCNMLDS